MALYNPPCSIGKERIRIGNKEFEDGKWKEEGDSPTLAQGANGSVVYFRSINSFRTVPYRC